MQCEQTVDKVAAIRGRQGFTLIEVLIAMAIFAVGILAVGAMQISSSNNNTGARIQTEEYTWVIDQIERLTGLGYDEEELDAGAHSISRWPYTVSWTVTENDPVDGAKRIAVTADGEHKQVRPLTIEFIKAR